MPFRFAQEPPNGGSVIRASLSRLATRPNPLAEKRVDFSAPQLSQPHAVYDLRADLIAQGGGLETASMTGFRYLVSDSTGSVVAAAEVQVNSVGQATTVSHINDGPYVSATADAIGRIGTLPEVNAGSYELRLLRFAAAYMMALWLKSDTGGSDIIYPLAPTPPPLEANRPYSSTQFIQAVRPIAERRASRTDRNAVP